jgi:endoglucanase
MKVLFAMLWAGWAMLRLSSAQMATDLAADPTPDSPEFKLGRGVNLGNMLEATKEGAWGQTVQEDYFPTIAQAGFTVIRVPIRWSAHVGPAPDYTIDPAFFHRVDWVVAQAEKNGLKAILDYHNDDALMKDPDANGERFIAIWKQIAEHDAGAPPSILFELLNEPNGKLDSAHWNDLLAKALAVVRISNPTRVVVVGPAAWNSIRMLPELVLPESDRNLLVTFHFYDPFHFTHQGAEWVEGSQAWLGTTWGTDADKKAINDSFDRAAKWGSDHRRPMYLGEFGAYSKSPIEGRARWTAFVRSTSEEHGMPWTYWEFCSGFGVYDPVAGQWRQPLLAVLLGK